MRRHMGNHFGQSAGTETLVTLLAEKTDIGVRCLAIGQHSVFQGDDAIGVAGMTKVTVSNVVQPD